MKKIFLFAVIIAGFNLYSQSTQTKDISYGTNKLVIIQHNNSTYKYILDNDATDKAKRFYTALLKKTRVNCKLNELPLVVANLISINSKPPFFIISKKKGARFTLIVFKNIIETFFKDKLGKLIDNKIEQSVNSQETLTASSFYTRTLLHLLSHFTGPSIIKNTSGKFVLNSEIIGDNFKKIEELRADMLALTITNSLITVSSSKTHMDTLLQITKKEQYNIFISHIAYLIYLSDNGTQEQKELSLIQLELFKKKGCLFSNIITKKYSLDINEFRVIIKKLLKKFTKFEKNAISTDVQSEILSFFNKEDNKSIKDQGIKYD
jgi:hypothetical protein